jgi:hypothetical protein
VRVLILLASKAACRNAVARGSHIASHARSSCSGAAPPRHCATRPSPSPRNRVRASLRSLAATVHHRASRVASASQPDSMGSEVRRKLAGCPARDARAMALDNTLPARPPSPAGRAGLDQEQARPRAGAVAGAQAAAQPAAAAAAAAAGTAAAAAEGREPRRSPGRQGRRRPHLPAPLRPAERRRRLAGRLAARALARGCGPAPLVRVALRAATLRVRLAPLQGTLQQSAS